MIKKSLLFCFVIFSGWNVILLFYFKDGASQHQWQDNVIKAQKFIYNDTDTIQNVIVGSSLSCRLVWDSIPEFYDLSMNGLSLFDVLAILEKKEKLPENIFIEINVLLRPASESFYNTLFSPIPYYLKKHVISFRDDKQPLAIMGNNYLLPLSGKLIYETKKWFTRPGLTGKHPHENNKKGELQKTEQKNDLGNTELFDKIIKGSIEELSKEPKKNT